MMLHSQNATSNTRSVAEGMTGLHDHHTGQVLMRQLHEVVFVHVLNFAKVVHSVLPK